MEKIDYAQIGLKVGIEVHQQLDTEAKMFCACPTKLSSEDPEITFLRRLRPTQSELGQMDPAALFEFQKGRTTLYEADGETSCLVEMDEEPPHRLNEEAVEIALTVAALAGCNPIDEIHVMRKIVIDGSNTTGFQRTCIVAMGGSVPVGEAEMPLTQICLEEDAARKTGEEGMTVRYRIDRLGIPLVEVTTGPYARSPAEAQEMALAIGRLLRATRKVKRGLGTIRQDLNVSILGGALTEIKGVQKLDLISRVVEYEVQRQLQLLRISKELRTRGLSESLTERFVDVTGTLKESQSRLIRDALVKGGVILAVKLIGLGGLLKTELEPGLRLGTEMAHRAAFWGGVQGILHSDELPGYGISEEELARVLTALGAGEQDAIVLVADKRENCIDALTAVVERAREALRGVPEETRASNEDGTTRYMRPRPGAARMYPETDVPPFKATTSMLNRIQTNLPPLPDVVREQLIRDHGINVKLADQLADSDYLPLFETLTRRTNLAGSFIATMLTETFKALERDGVSVQQLDDNLIAKTFELVDKGATAKESLADVFSWLCRNPGTAPKDAIDALSLGMMTEGELERIVKEKIQSSMPLIRQLGQNSQGKIVGFIMSEVRGRADPRLVSDIVRRTLSSIIAKQ